MENYIFLNNKSINLNENYESIKKFIFLNHEKNIKSEDYKENISVDIESVKFFIKNKKEDDLLLFFNLIKEETTYKDLYSIYELLTQDMKIDYLKLIENEIFKEIHPDEFSERGYYCFLEEQFRHKLIFALLNFRDYEEILDKWDDLKTMNFHLGKKKSIKTEFFWKERIPELFPEFFDFVLNSNKYYILAQLNENNKTIMDNPEELLYANLSFDNEERTSEIFQKIKLLSPKNSNSLNNNSPLSDLIDRNENIYPNNIFLLKKYYDLNNPSKKINIFSCLNYLIMSSKRKEDSRLLSLNNNFFLTLLKECEKSSFEELKMMNVNVKMNIWKEYICRTWSEYIENKESLVLINNHLENAGADIKKVLSEQAIYINFEIKHSERELFEILDEIKKYKPKMSYILNPEKFLLFSKLDTDVASNISNLKGAEENLNHYLPLLIKYLKANNIKMDLESSNIILKGYHNHPNKLTRLYDNINKVLLSDLVDVKDLNILYKNYGFSQISLFKSTIIEKEKKEILKNVNITENNDEKYKKRI